MITKSSNNPLVSIIILTYNTQDLCKRCLDELLPETQGISSEVIVVDNGSKDDTIDMLRTEYPQVKSIKLEKNIGFGAGNNVGYKEAKGKYIIILNSDAFMTPGSLKKSIELMETHPKAGIGGAKLISPDGSWQPSARAYPSFLNDILMRTGLNARYPKSKFFGRCDRTWAPIDQDAEVDWVPGAFSIIRKEGLEKLGFFDERFFLYYEEVDLCKRFKDAGYQIWYWPEIIVTHIGGETTKNDKSQHFSKTSSQLTLWQLRSRYLYYYKHYGALSAFLAMQSERLWHRLRAWKNKKCCPEKAQESETLIRFIDEAWADNK